MSSKCPRCFGRGALCLCAQIQSITTTTRFIVLRHVLEEFEQSNTVRLLELALTSCEVRPYGRKDSPPHTADFSPESTWVLFPEGPPPESLTVLPSQVVVLDGSWSQARRMFQRMHALRGLRLFSLPHVETQERLRTAPVGGMSTLEAVARAVEWLEGTDRAAPLMKLNEAMLARVRAARGYV
jgi:DTW domain-containing protein YfiP